MYKAIHAQTGEEIIILNPRWRARIEDLREMDQADLLLCQGCQQSMRVKAGDVKRPHFAHKHLKACSYGSESLDILNGRAVLYGWLFRQFGEDVTVEKQIDGSGLPRPVDCWVETINGMFAYWIIEAGIKIEPREAIKKAFTGLPIKVHYVFLRSMLVEEKKEFHSLLLSPTERVFLQQSPYDEMLAGMGDAGKSIHYLDAEGQTLITFRHLLLHHRPNWYKGHKKTANLDMVRANRTDGSFVYPGENDRLSSYLQKQRRLEQKRSQFEQREKASTMLSDSPETPARRGWGIGERDVPGETGQLEVMPLTCAICGRVTMDYWSTFFNASGEKVCRCRACLEEGKA